MISILVTKGRFREPLYKSLPLDSPPLIPQRVSTLRVSVSPSAGLCCEPLFLSSLCEPLIRDSLLAPPPRASPLLIPLRPSPPRAPIFISEPICLSSSRFPQPVSSADSISNTHPLAASPKFHPIDLAHRLHRCRKPIPSSRPSPPRPPQPRHLLNSSRLHLSIFLPSTSWLRFSTVALFVFSWYSILHWPSRRPPR